MESDATRSAAMPTSCSERAVLWPMAATLVPWSALESSPASRRRPNTASTAFVLVNTTQSKPGRRRSASSISQ